MRNPEAATGGSLAMHGARRLITRPAASAYQPAHLVGRPPRPMKRRRMETREEKPDGTEPGRVNGDEKRNEAIRPGNEEIRRRERERERERDDKKSEP